jgi:hypothetical protein
MTEWRKLFEEAMALGRELLAEMRRLGAELRAARERI